MPDWRRCMRFFNTSSSCRRYKTTYWKDIQTVAVNKEYPRTAFMTYDNRDQALTGEYENSPYYKLLNGTWNFYYADTYKDLPANIEQPDAT